MTYLKKLWQKFVDWEFDYEISISFSLESLLIIIAFVGIFSWFIF